MHLKECFLFFLFFWPHHMALTLDQISQIIISFSIYLFVYYLFSLNFLLTYHTYMYVCVQQCT